MAETLTAPPKLLSLPPEQPAQLQLSPLLPITAELGEAWNANLAQRLKGRARARARLHTPLKIVAFPPLFLSWWAGRKVGEDSAANEDNVLKIQKHQDA